MNANNIKGALLEYIVRNLLKNCNFTNVKADGLYSFEKNGLFFVNGKGAAHDMDVIMNPPIQMPFTYPTQLIFECKAYGSKANLPIVRNALGLRNDLNDFEIVTKQSILKRQNNRRASYAIETRLRFLYQVGVASINDFSKPAIEFASNNKIPLLSLNWFLSHDLIEKFNSIEQSYINTINSEQINNLYKFFKDKNGNLDNIDYSLAKTFLNQDNTIFDIVSSTNFLIGKFFIGLLETGDLVFLFSNTENNILSNDSRFRGLKTEIHYLKERPNVWKLTVFDPNNESLRSSYDFHIPNRIYNHWKEFNLDKTIALDIKQKFFSKIFIFNKGYDPNTPFSIINMDLEWLDRATQEEQTDEEN